MALKMACGHVHRYDLLDVAFISVTVALHKELCNQKGTSHQSLGLKFQAVWHVRHRESVRSTSSYLKIFDPLIIIALVDI